MISKKNIIIVFLLFSTCTLFIVSPVSSTDTETVYSSKDAHVYSKYPNNNYGDNTEMYCGNWNDGSNTYQDEAFLFFDLSSTTQGWDEVKLYLTITSIPKSLTFKMCESSAGWSESSIIWNNRPSHDSHLMTFSIDNDATWIIDVTSCVSGSQFSICIYAEYSQWGTILIRSREHSTTSSRPRLVFSYSASPPEEDDSEPSWEIDKTGYVDYIYDGDTFNLSTDETIRLADIDTPEVGDPGADEATAYLTSLIYEKDVYLDVDDKYGIGPYGRTIAVVYVRYDETYLKNVNKALLDEGHAVVDDYDNEFDPSDWTLLVEYPSNPPPEEPEPPPEEPEPPPQEPTVTPELSISSPNSASSWYEGNTYTIEWSSQGDISFVDINLYRSGTLIQNIVNGTENDGEYDWYISPTENFKGGNYRIQICDYIDATVEDYSSIFKINYAEITITKLSSSITMKPGEIYTITWTSLGFIDEVKIELYKGSVFFETIISNTENDGLYEWTVGNYETGTDYCIYIRDFDDLSVFDSCPSFKIENNFIPMMITGGVITVIVGSGTTLGILYIYFKRKGFP